MDQATLYCLSYCSEVHCFPGNVGIVGNRGAFFRVFQAIKKPGCDVQPGSVNGDAKSYCPQPGHHSRLGASAGEDFPPIFIYIIEHI